MEGKKKNRTHEASEKWKLPMNTQGLGHPKILLLDQNEKLWFFPQWLD